MTSLYDFCVQDIQGNSCLLNAYKGQVLLIVNVASKCGFTPQYAELQGLYDTYHPQGFTVLGFPCNQFGHQEPDEALQIQRFCTDHYQISFPLFAKIAVNGPHAHPLYQWLKRQKRGLLGTASIKWNFTKFLVGRHGQVLGRFASTRRPATLARHIQRALRS